ncbi:MAG: hypothetical protein CME70_18655 [Halobacteriovorax sp.]|nr:hypothetical protein [Halobacteriovorax sp.]
MSSTTFKKRDLNRWKKVYPFVKRTPRWAWISDLNFQMEVAEIPFTPDMVEGTHIFTCTFPGPPEHPPIVTCIAKSFGGDPNDPNMGVNVNATVTHVDYQTVTIHVSNPFEGSVMLHAIWIECP